MLAILANAALEAENTKTEENVENALFPINVLIIFLILSIYVFAGSAFEHFQLHYLHESGMAIMLGGILGFGYFVYNQYYPDDAIKVVSFNEQYFFYFLLPPIIFSSGYNLKTRKFFQNLPQTLLFGIVGTLLNFTITMALTYVVSISGLILVSVNGNVSREHLAMSDMFIFSATICSSDTVAAVTMIKYKEHPKLYSIIFGEGLVNDAVSIILFQTVVSLFNGSTTMTWSTPLTIIGHFLSLASLSILMGITIGIISAIVLRRASFMEDNPSAQTILVLGFGYFAYIVSELCGLSGVISLLITGAVMSHYSYYNLSQSAQITTGIMCNTLSLLAEGFIFLYLGLSAFFYANDKWSFTFILCEIGIIFTARFVGVFVLSWLAKLYKGKAKWKLDASELGIIWFAGLIRGAIALALILSAPIAVLLRTTVLALVLITTVVLGALMPSFIRLMLSKRAMRDRAKSIETPLTRVGPSETIRLLEETIYKFKNKKYDNRLHFYWRVFDDTFMKPWLIRDYDPETQRLRRKLKYGEFGGGRLNLTESGRMVVKFKSAPTLTAPLLNRRANFKKHEDDETPSDSTVNSKLSSFAPTHDQEESFDLDTDKASVAPMNIEIKEETKVEPKIKRNITPKSVHFVE